MSHLFQYDGGKGGLIMQKPIGLFVVLVLAIALACGCSFRTLVPVSGIHKVKGNAPVVVSCSQDQYEEELESILRAIDTYYAHKTRKGIDINALRAEFSPRVQSAKNSQELNLIFMELFARLQNGHSGLYNWMKEYGAPAQAALIENRLVIAQVVDLPLLSDAGVQRGWEIVEIDNQPVADWLHAETKLISASTDHFRRFMGALRTFVRYETEPQTRHYRLRSPEGKTVEMDLPLTTPRNELFRGTGRGLVEAKDLGRFGYIAVYSMVDGVVEQFDQALKGLMMKDGIIIDLRNNGGGNSANGDQIMRRLVQKSTPGWYRTARPHQELNYAGPVVALISNYTFSAAESFAFDLFDSGRVTVMGEPTGGDSGGGPQRFVTDGGIQFRIPTRGLDHSASGLPMEGVGLKPHIAVSQLYADFLAGKDTALEAAKAKLMELAGQKP